MKIVILDGFTCNPGDLNWEPFQSLGDCEIFDRSCGADVAARARHAEIVITNKSCLDRRTIESLPRLKYIGVLATGYNIVDTQAARARGVPVTNVPDYGSPAVAQAVFALLLELTHHAGHHAQTVRDGRWSRSADWCYWDFPLIELCDLTMGIVGYGKIGQVVGRIARSFGMKLLAAKRTPAPGGGEVEFVNLDALLQRSDVVTLHCPLTPETKEMINAGRLTQMKSTALLINTARGGLVQEADLADALNAGRIAGAGLDVLSVEPPPATNPLLQAKNCVITPHIAWAARNSRRRLMQKAADNLKAFLAGKPQNVVN